MSEENFERSLEINKSEASAISEKVSVWWKEISAQANSAASPGKLYAIGNYLVVLVKNSLSDGKSDGKVTAIFDEEKITVLIEDFGSEDREINLNIGGEYGLKEIIEYADDLFIEANGSFYEKNRRNQMEETDDSDLRTGSKVTLIKYIGAKPVGEQEEEYRAKRNFAERM